MANEPPDIASRKLDHLELCATDAVAFRERTTLLEHVRLVHDALPDLSLDELDTSVEVLGKRLRAPILIAGMTGGHERATEVNRTLARVAEARGYAFGLGSQRALALDAARAETYRVREVAPSVLLLGNLGVVQAREMSTEAVDALVRDVHADALCVHMNPAMELVQPGGDRDFRGGLETFRRLAAELSVPVIAKETGAGIGLPTARRLALAGVRYADTSGAGGTSWVGVETLRAEGNARALGEALWDWGIPTAASVAHCVEAGLVTLATGGIATGLDVARALALGATAAGVARAALMALTEGGEAAVHTLFDRVENELRAVMLLVGTRDLAALRSAPRLVTGELRDWLSLEKAQE
jgi:isopentenyl-diphosphate Delta-isomerase